MLRLFPVGEGDRDAAAADVVFVHGLGGDAHDTWSADKAGKLFWPAWIAADLPSVGVYTVAYDASPSAWRGPGLGVIDNATAVLSLLDANDIGQRPLVFVAHSLGGLVVKQLLRHADGYGQPAWQALLGRVRGVCFLATPHEGARLATIVKRIGQLARPTAALGDLEANTAPLRDLDTWFRNSVGRLGVTVSVFMEGRDTRGVRVVDEASSDPKIAGVVPVPIGVDHIEIARPKSRDELVYLAVLKFIRQAAGAAPGAGAPAAPPPPPAPAAATTAAPASPPTHRRQFSDRRIVIDDEDLLAAIRNPHLNASSEFQARLASELVAFLRLRHEERLGPGAAAWREGEVLMLSALPDIDVPQRTLEFEPREGGYGLTGERKPLDPLLQGIAYWEWQPAVADLFADRVPINMAREAALLILRKKGAPLGFPVGPRGAGLVPLCEWVGPDRAPEDYLEWGRDPRLVPGKVTLQATALHRPTGVAFLSYCLQGSWTPGAILALREGLEVLLPERAVLREVEYGAIRVDVFLGLRDGPPVDTLKIFLRNRAAILRMDAATRDISVPPPLPANAVAPPGEADAKTFREVFDLIGDDQEYPKLTDSAAGGFWEADWIKLRQDHLTETFERPEPPRFDVSAAATAQGLRRLLASFEGQA